jgi:hypothetical protein
VPDEQESEKQSQNRASSPLQVTGNTLARLDSKLFSAYPSEYVGDRMPNTTEKQRILDAVRTLPEDATLEDAIERLYFVAKVQRGLDQLNAGQGVSHADAKKRILGA